MAEIIVGDSFGFDRALQLIRAGHRVCRAAWKPGWVFGLIDGNPWCADQDGNYERIWREDYMAEDWRLTSLPLLPPQSAAARRAFIPGPRDALPATSAE